MAAPGTRRDRARRRHRTATTSSPSRHREQVRTTVRARYKRVMSRHRDTDLTSDPSAEHLADAPLLEAELHAADARSGGDPARAPRSLRAAELVPDDEAIASSEDWDDPQRL
ncbi:hypothetical protein GCM10023113_11680 [Cellulomonas oligotrophica]|uniref:Uncharacterized protein n=2 Tax=Cellulomonas oligotrophica TaxID=931536 RepID=A0ABQ4D811_9CELL|nr:hypothetical protein Col01nite_10150 [Cellulomonas oligotrophica]